MSKPRSDAVQVRPPESEHLIVEPKAGSCVVVHEARRVCTLRDMAAKITPQNCHCETDWGARQGEESC